MSGVSEKARGFCVHNKAYIFSFFIPALILFASYMCFGVYPAGERSVIGLDLNAQYVYYFDYMKDVFAGKESIFYCWSGSLSGEFFGTFAYYLASPFNLIVWLFPRNNITEGILAMLLVKSSAVGLSTAFYLKKKRGFSDLTAVLFSTGFALSGYFVAQTLNPMWLDGLIALPVVITGVEMICEKRSFLPYIISLVYIFAANFYIGYMVGIFSAMYFVYYLFMCGKGRIHADRIVVYTVSSVSAIMLCCPIFFPMLKALNNGKLADSADFTPKENFNLLDSFIKLFPGTYDTLRPVGLPMIYCSTAALIFAVIWFSMKKIPLLRRIGGGCLLGLLFLSMYIKPLDMLWHGGRVPVWMPYRYAFIVSFLLMSFGAEAFDNIKNIRLKQVGGAFLLLLGVLLFCDYYAGNDRFDTTLVIVIPLIALAAAASASAWLVNSGKKAAAVTLCVITFGELAFNTYDSLEKAHEDIYYSKRASYTDDIPITRSVVNEIRENDDGFYRMEKTFHRTVNDPMALRMYGVSHSTSTYNTGVIDLLKELGFGARDHYSRYDGASIFTDDVLGIKYVLSKNETFVPYGDVVSVNSDIKVYENKDSFGVAFLADKGCIGADFNGEIPFDNHESLASRLSGSERKFYHDIENIEFSSENIDVGSTTDGHISYKKRSESSDASVTYKVTMPHKGIAYMYFPTNYERKCDLSLNGSYVKKYYKNENYSIVYLGSYDKGGSFEVKLKLLEDALYIKKALFVYLDEDEYNEFNRSIHAKNPDTRIERTGTAALKISVHADENRALFTSIPYEEGWTAKIDGKETEILSTANGTLMCFDIPEGDHIVTLSFFPAKMKTGFIFFFIGAAVLAGLIILSRPKFNPDGASDEDE